MKKLLALLCSVALLLTGPLATVFNTAFAEETEERFIQNFSTFAEYDKAVNVDKKVNNAGTNINLEYDSDEGALKATPAQTGAVKNHQVRIDPVQGAKTVKVDEYPVVAVKIKFNNSATPRFGGVNAGTNKSMRPSGSTDSVFSTLQFAGIGKSGDWQLLIWDGTSSVYNTTNGTGSKNFCGTYEGFICMLTDNNQTTTADDIYWIQWAGAFKTVEEVYEYEQEMVSPYFYDFTDKTATEELIAADACNKRVVGAANNTISYDAEKGALKIDATDGATNAGQFNPMPYLDKSTKVASYPVIAFKVKVNNTANKFDRLFVGTTGRTVSGGNYNNDLGVISNKPTGGWQLVIIDGTDLVYDANDSTTKTWFDGTYGNMIIKLMADSTAATADDIWWIRWAGVFESVEDVYAYDGSTEAPFLYDFTDEDVSKNVTKSGAVKDDGCSFNYSYNKTEKALEVAPKVAQTANRFWLYATANASVTKYPVIAMKVKVANPEKNFGGIAPSTLHGKGGSSLRYGYVTGSKTGDILETGNWQTIVFDMRKLSDQTYATGNWHGFLVATVFNGEQSATTDSVYIKWAGAFKSVEDAYAYDDALNAPFFYSFSNEAETNNLIDNGAVITDGSNTKISYDADKSALKIAPDDLNKANAGKIAILADNITTEVSDYPVVAIKIRANTTARPFGEIYAGTWNNGSGSKYPKGNEICPSYQRTGDWELLIFDGTNTNKQYYKGQWFGLVVQLLSNNVLPTERDVCWVQWAGAFKTVAEAQAYYAQTASPEEEPSDTPFLYSFKEEAETNDLIKGGNVTVGDGKNTVLAYDKTEGALKVSPKDINEVNAGKFEIRADNATTEVSEYPVVAMKIKANNVNRAFGEIYAGTFNNGKGSKYISAGKDDTGKKIPKTGNEICPSYQRTGDWELLLFDGTNTDKLYYKGQWYGLLVYPMSNNIKPTADDVCWIEWAGVFKTAAEAEAYYLKSCNSTGVEESEIGDGSGKEAPSGFFYNFTDRATTEALIKGTNGKHLIHNGGGNNTIFSHDLTMSALKIQPKSLTEKMAARFVFEADNATTNTADYPIYAIKIKVDTVDEGFAGMWAGTQNSGQKSIYSGPELLDQSTHATTGKWQLIIVDNTGNKGFSGQWKAMLFRMLNDDVLAQAGETCWVQWAGAFKSVEDVYAYADMGAQEEEDDGKPPFFYDFSNKVDTNIWLGNGKVSAEKGTNTKLTYDETEKALKLGTADTENKKAGRLSILANGTAAVKDYPVMAVMVKLNNTNRAFGGILPGTEREGGGNKFEISNVLKSYQRTNEWQLLVFDGTEFGNEAYTGNWFGFLVRLMGENAVPTADDYCFIKWAGAFKTAKDAYDFAGMAVPPPVVDTSPSPFFYNFTEEWEAVGYIEDNAVSADGNSNTKISYDATQKALKVEPKNYTDKNANVLALYDRGEAINVEDYPVVALKIKVKNTASMLNSIWAGTNSKYPTKFRVQLPIDPYQATEDWQYIVIDASGYEVYDDAYTGTWFGLIFKLMDINTVATAKDVFYIQWAGVFADADAAYEYAGIENPKKNTSSDPDGLAPTKFFWDLTKNDVITNHVSAIGDTKTEYDFATNSMKVTVTDTDSDNAVQTTPGRFILGEEIPVKEEVKATDYPFIALRVKLSKDTLSGGWAHYRTTYSIEKYLAGDMDASDCEVKILNYEPSSEWQTVVIDCTADPTAAFFFDGNWSALKFDMISSVTAQDGDEVFVKWAGAFANEKDIEDYIKATEGDDSEEDVVTEKPVEKKGLSPVTIVIIVVAAVLVTAGGAAAGIIFFKKKRTIGK